MDLINYCVFMIHLKDQKITGALYPKLRQRIGSGLISFGLIIAVSGCQSLASSSSTSQPASTPSIEASSEPTSPAVSDEEFKRALSHLKTKSDDVDGIKWFLDKNGTWFTNENDFSVYFGCDLEDSKAIKERICLTEFKPHLRLKIQYAGEDWLFINSFIFNVDGERDEITPDYGDIKRDNGNGLVWEDYDVRMYADQVDLIQRIIKSKKAVLRLEGDMYRKDVTISKSQKAALEHVLTVWRGLKGNEPV